MKTVPLMKDGDYWSKTGLIALNCAGFLGYAYALINGTVMFWLVSVCAMVNAAGAIFWLYKLAKSEGVL